MLRWQTRMSENFLISKLPENVFLLYRGSRAAVQVGQTTT